MNATCNIYNTFPKKKKLLTKSKLWNIKSKQYRDSFDRSTRSVFKPGEKEHRRCVELEYALKPRNATFPLMKPCATSRVRRTHPRPVLGGKNARAWMCAFRIACINRFDRFARSARSNSKDSFAGSTNQPSWSEKNRLISRLILNGPFIVAREEIEGGSNWNAMGGVIKEEILACVEIGIRVIEISRVVFHGLYQI